MKELFLKIYKVERKAPAKDIFISSFDNAGLQEFYDRYFLMKFCKIFETIDLFLKYTFWWLLLLFTFQQDQDILYRYKCLDEI